MSQAAKPRGTVEGASPHPPYLWASVAGGLVFLLYGLTLATTTAFWDTSEYIATGYIMGIPHPPGNPLFVVLARAWILLLEPFGLPVAARVNLFSAFMSAAAHGLWFLVVHHVLRFFSENRAFRLAGAGVSVLVSSSAFTVWNQSNVNEKVYTVSLLTIALLSWLVIRWQERLGRGKDDNLLVLLVFILALSVGNHLMAFLAAPAMAVLILLVNPRAILNWKLYPAALVAGLVGLSIHLFLPIRAELDPVINEGAPECVSLGEALVSVATYGGAGCEPLSASLNRSQYKVEGEAGAGLTGSRQSPLPDQLTNYLQYFDWQWGRSLEGDDYSFPLGRILLTMLFTGLGVWGAMEHYRRDLKSFAYMATLFGTLSLGLVYYLNFKYGYSLPDPVGDYTLHEVRERDYFFIISFSVWGLWAGVGIATIWRSLALRLAGASHTEGGSEGAPAQGSAPPASHPSQGEPQGLGEATSGLALAKASPILVLGFIPLLLNFSWANRNYDYAARDWAYNLLMSVEPYGLLFTNGDNDTFPLWYLQEVEGIRRDVSVVVTSYLNTAWYPKQLRDLTRTCPDGVSAQDDPTRIICQREYTAENTGAMYTHDPSLAEVLGKVPLSMPLPVALPTGGLLDLEDDVLDRVAGAFVPLEDGQVFTLGPVRATMPPGSYLLPWQQFALAMVRASFETGRPVYFASSGNAAESLGLSPYLVREGLAFRLNPGLPEEIPLPGVEALPAGSPLSSVTGYWIRSERTRALAEEVFVHRSGLPDWDHWPDHSTVGIPNYYAWVYYSLVQAYAGRDDQAAERYRLRGDAWSRLGS
ncbi:MAG: DUF2723 domain-containing protein [Gemmatimonadales bacterium]|nr:MAG: DUF2723 domain-containing protein [Gemmatimonadales bacterium]